MQKSYPNSNTTIPTDVVKPNKPQSDQTTTDHYTSAKLTEIDIQPMTYSSTTANTCQASYAPSEGVWLLHE